MSRPACALVSAQALQHNMTLARKHAVNAKIMAIIKANGYGHGLTWVAHILQDADAFGVASVEEGVALRDICGQQPICLLEGFFEPKELDLLVRHNLSPAIHNHEQLEQLGFPSSEDKPDIWIKVDTGMHRLGFSPEELPHVLQRLKNYKGIGKIRLMSHLANADDRSDSTTRHQIKCFLSLVNDSEIEHSLANSAGLVAWPESRFDWVRPGIMLFGVSPLLDSNAFDLDLRPVMTLQTRLIAIRQLHKGDRIGYGGEWACPEDMPIGVAAIGYGDGYPRHAPAGTPVLVSGKPVTLVGRVSMDMITVDLRNNPHARVGDPVVLWGEGLPVEEIARHAGTIGYELLCLVSERIPRVPVT